MRRVLAEKIERVVRVRLGDYLARRATLHAFVQWFVPATWDVNDDAPARLRTLVFGIKEIVDAYGGGYATEDQLRAELAPFAESVTILKPHFSGWVILRTAGPELSGTPHGSVRQSGVTRLRPPRRGAYRTLRSDRNRLTGLPDSLCEEASV